jgi:hypothetical protein
MQQSSCREVTEKLERDVAKKLDLQDTLDVSS